MFPKGRFVRLKAPLIWIILLITPNAPGRRMTMNKPKVELADILRRHIGDYRKQ